jgi:hypothetical protein
MAIYYLKNSLNPDGPVVPVTVDIKMVQDVVYEPDGDSIWVVDFTTSIKDVDGDTIPCHTIHLRGANQTIDDVISDGLAWVGQRVDWGTLQDDVALPYVDSYGPTQTTNVPIASEVFFNIKDELPSAGIDPSSITLVVNGIDVTDQLDIVETSSVTKVKWNPVRVY